MKGKRFLALLLVGAMVLSMAACGSKSEETPATTQKEETTSKDESAESKTEPVNELEWLNTTGTLPIVKEGTEKTLSVYVKMQPDSGEPEDLWMVKDLIGRGMNINLEVTKFTTDNQEEILSLAFASGELPDIIIGGDFSTADLMYYGASEGQLLDLAPYVNETYMPRLSSYFAENPLLKNAITDSEGHIWSLGLLYNSEEPATSGHVYLNYAKLEEYGLKAPQTLDEFVNAMRVFREKGGEDCYPISGSFTYYPVTYYMLNAFGYLTNNAQGSSMAMRNGKPVLPYADREAYGDYLTLMHTLYEEKLIHPDYFTMDKDTTKAHMADTRNGFIAFAPFLYITEDWPDWFGGYPLTSDWNDTQQWPSGIEKASTAGGFVVTSACEEPELAAAFADWFYDDTHYFMTVSGPEANLYPDLVTEEVWGWTWNENGIDRDPVATEENPNPVAEQYDTGDEFSWKHVQLWGTGVFGANLSTAAEGYWETFYEGLDMSKPESELRLAMTNPDKQWSMGLFRNINPYYTDALFPAYIYLDTATSEELNNMKIVMDEYAEQESAKFITGARDLSELDAYFDEIERLGATEYVEFYTNYYNSLQ